MYIGLENAFFFNAVTYPALVISKLPLVLKLVSEGKLDLRQLAKLTLGLFQLAQEVGVLSSQLLLGGIEVVQGPGGFVQLVVNLVDVVLELLGHLLSSGLS